jgi:hypothetical protein
MVYQSVILENINKNVVHMVTYQRQRDIGGLRRVMGYEEGYHNTRSVYMDVPIADFNAQYVRPPFASPPVASIPSQPDRLVLAIRCIETNTMWVSIMLKSEFLEESPDMSHVPQVRFEVNYIEGCAICGRPTTKVCQRCRQVRYCCRECQVSDLPNHRPGCRIIGELRARGA